MTDEEFKELLKGVLAGDVEKEEKIERKSGEDLEEVLDRASKNGKLLTYEEVDEVIKEIEAEEKRKKEADGMSESQDPKDMTERVFLSLERKPTKEKQKEVPRRLKITKRRLVLKDEEEQEVVEKVAKRTSTRLLGRGKAKKAGRRNPVDTVEVSSEEESTPLEKKSEASPTGQENSLPRGAQ